MMHYPTRGTDLREDNAVLSPGLLNYNRELRLICLCGAHAHPIPLFLTFLALAHALHPPLSSLSQPNNKSRLQLRACTER